jgi:hypothetical protein
LEISSFVRQHQYNQACLLHHFTPLATSHQRAASTMLNQYVDARKLAFFNINSLKSSILLSNGFSPETFLEATSISSYGLLFPYAFGTWRGQVREQYFR